MQTKQFSGIMNLDDPDDVIPFVHHKEARNLVFRGNGANMRAQTIPGNVLIPNTDLPAGTNVCIGAWYDQVKRRIFSFIYNSNGNNGIYVYNTITNTLQTLLQCGSDTEGDILLFDIQKPIINVAIIYGDNQQGDILYWLNSQGKPCKLNVNRASFIPSFYAPWKASYLDVAKEPPPLLPYVVYEDDATVTVNNLRKRLFKVKIRWVFDDLEKSTTSIQSEIPLPFDPFEPSVDTDATQNCRIGIVYGTGPNNVTKIEILMAVSTGNQFSDFFLVKTVDKSEENRPSNDINVYHFYNNQAYNYIDKEESDQLFDYVPLVAMAQETLNGNVLIYGNITEGYDNLMNFSNGTTESNIQSLATPSYEGRYLSLLATSQSGNSGFGTGAVHFIVKGKVTVGNVYRITFTDLTTVEYTALLGDTIQDVVDGLSADAISKGFTVSQPVPNPDFVYITKANTVLAYSYVIPNTLLENIENAADGSLNAYNWWSRYGFGLVYFDEKERTNGVVYTDGFSVETIEYQDFLTIANIPRLEAAIYHRPPIWAKRFSWVRTQNLTKSKFVQWISISTVKYVSGVLGESSFAYIGIENLNAFKLKNPNTPLGYSFNSNDRIRFIKRLDMTNATLNVYDDRDYEIQASEINPNIDGIQYVGQFIKIFLPATDSDFDFGSDDYNHYFIELYTPAQPVAGGLDVYYEFGERYTIGSPGEPSRIHQGQFQNQSADLVFPATYTFVKGDDYTRYRIIQVGAEAQYSLGASSCNSGNAGRITLGATFLNQTNADPDITFGNSPCQDLVGFDLATNTDRDIIQIGTGTFTFRIKGSVSITFPDDRVDDEYEFFLQKNNGTKIVLQPGFNSSLAGTYTFSFDTTFTMTSGERVFIFGWSVPPFNHSRTFNSTNFTITRVAALTQTIIDPNFSDYYPSAVNSNGRAFIHDADAHQVSFPVLTRWSLDYQPDTNINKTNRFYPQNQDTVDRSKGAIQRFKARDRVMRVFQERACGQLGIFSRFIQNNEGESDLITTDAIITADNIQYYQGEFGIGNHPESLVSGSIQDYFVDPVRGYQMRLSNDGLTPISEIYKGQFYIRNLLTPYNKEWSRPDGSLAKILGVYDSFEEEYITILQSGTNGSATINNYVFAFNEKRNGYSSFRDYVPEWMVCAEDMLYGWRNGNLYVHNSSTYCNFFGVQYGASIVCVFNQNLIQKKTWMSVAEIANTTWDCPLIYTNVMSYGDQRQESNLVLGNFRVLEQSPSASFMRDINSNGGKINGDFLKGNLIVILFRLVTAPKLYFLSEVSVKYIDSPLTPI